MKLTPLLIGAATAAVIDSTEPQIKLLEPTTYLKEGETLTLDTKILIPEGLSSCVHNIVLEVGFDDAKIFEQVITEKSGATYTQPFDSMLDFSVSTEYPDCINKTCDMSLTSLAALVTFEGMTLDNTDKEVKLTLNCGSKLKTTETMMEIWQEGIMDLVEKDLTLVSTDKNVTTVATCSINNESPEVDMVTFHMGEDFSREVRVANGTASLELSGVDLAVYSGKTIHGTQVECHAKQLAGDKVVHNYEAYSEEKIEFRYEPSYAKISVNQADIKRGDEVHVSCEADGFPYPDMSIEADGEIISSASTGGIMSADKKIKENTRFTCRAGTLEQSKTVKVFFLEENVVLEVHNQTAYADDDITLKCKATSQPAPEYSFYQNGTLLGGTGESEIIVPAITGLVIFECKAKVFGGNFALEKSSPTISKRFLPIPESESGSSKTAVVIIIVIIVILILAAVGFLLYKKFFEKGKKGHEEVPQDEEDVPGIRERGDVGDDSE